MPFYGTAVWDPALIIAQVRRHCSSWEAVWRTDQGVGAPPAALLCPKIVAVQSLFYVSLGALLLVTLGVSPPVPQPPCVAWLPWCVFACVSSPLTAPCASGGASPKLSLFYFFDYSAISVHSFMGWCAALGTPNCVSCKQCPHARAPCFLQDGNPRPLGQRCGRVRYATRRGALRAPRTDHTPLPPFAALAPCPLSLSAPRSVWTSR